MRYFIEANGHPEKRAELRLVVNAGSILEDDDQLGLAHFVEHMAFNGSEHFKGNQLISTLESFGMGFGAHLNAYTSFDERPAAELKVAAPAMPCVGKSWIALTATRASPPTLRP